MPWVNPKDVPCGCIPKHPLALRIGPYGDVFQWPPQDVLQTQFCQVGWFPWSVEIITLVYLWVFENTLNGLPICRFWFSKTRRSSLKSNNYHELPEIYPPLGITIWFGVSCVLLVDAILNIIHFAPTNFRFKRFFSGLGKLLTTENPLKMRKNAFYFILEVLFVLEIFTFLFGVFDYVERRLDEKAEINYSSTNIYNTHIAQYLKK